MHLLLSCLRRFDHISVYFLADVTLVVMLSTKESLQLRFIKPDPKKKQGASNHPECVQKDAGKGVGLGEFASRSVIQYCSQEAP